MRLVILLAGDRPESRAVGAALRDWSALGLLEPFIWAHAFADADGEIAGELVTAGSARPVQVVQYLADTPDVERVQLCAVTVLVGSQQGPGLDVCGRLRRRLTAMEAAGKASFLHVIIPAADAEPAQEPLAWPQWHNVVASPEDSRTPGSVADRLVAAGDWTSWTSFEAHGCSAIASLTGMWSGLQASLFDGAVREPEAGLRLARSFYRRLDAEAVTQELRQSVVGLAGGLPRPRQGQLQLEHFDNPGTAAAAVWAGVQQKHAALFSRERVPVPKAKRVQLTLRKALSMFFSFLAAAIRDAPRQWVTSVVGGLSQTVATGATRMLFGGDDSAFEVVVLGRSGRATDADELVSAVEALTSRAQVAFPDAEMRAGDHSSFWSDTLRTAIGLADGAPPPPGLEPARAGSQQGIMPEATDVVAAPDGDLHITGSIAALLSVDSLSAIDRLQTEHLLRRVKAEDSGMASPEQEKSRARIAEWLRRVDATYMGRVGLHLGRFLDQNRDEVAELWHRLQTAVASRQAPSSLVQAQLRLARRIRWRFIAVVVALIVVGVITGIGLISALIGIGLGAAALIVWFASSMSTFIRGQRELFIVMHKQRSDELGIPVWLENLQRAVRDLNTAAVLYAQYRQWARVLSQFLHEPFGRQRGQLPERTACVMKTNRAFDVATARPDPETVRVAAYRLSQDLFTTGWMQELWSLFLTDSFAAVDPIAPPGYDSVQRELLRDRATGNASRLSALADHVHEHGVSATGGQRHWTRALDELQHQPALLHDLLDNVQSWRGSVTGHGADFLGELTAQVPDEPTFNEALIADHARANQRWRQGWCAVVSAAGGAARLEYRGSEPPPLAELPSDGGSPGSLDSYALCVMVGGSVPEPHLVVSAPRSPEPPAPEPSRPARSDASYF